MSTNKKVTIRDVAAHVGVSISSVSRVLNGHPYVSKALRVRVEAAARELGYQPDFLAHSLRRGNTRSIGFLVGTISNPVMADIFASVANVLASYGYAMILVCSQNDPQLDASYLRFLAHRKVDGLIVSSAANGPDQASSIITELEIPTVMLDRHLPTGTHISAVQSDHAGGMRAAVRHLLDQGHRRIALIGGPEFFDPARERLRGFSDAFCEARVSVDPALVRSVGMHESAGYVETLALLTHPNPPTALIAGGNLILIGVLKALRERGIAIGHDLALVGCDDIDLARLYVPSITVIARDLRLLGETAARLLLETMQQGGGSLVTLPTRLVVRESSVHPLQT
jgi:LacI family transcriptional regulator